jgi:hypothetical protein
LGQTPRTRGERHPKNPRRKQQAHHRKRGTAMRLEEAIENILKAEEETIESIQSELIKENAKEVRKLAEELGGGLE